MPTQQPAQRDQKQSVRDHFGPVAANYASAAVHRAGPDLVALTEEASAARARRALDVGCGAGHTALALAPHADAVEALDLTQPMLDQVERLVAERGVANLRARLGDAEAIPYPDGHFDLVACRLCAHHFQRPGRAVAEMFRVLEPGGRLLLVDIVSPDGPELDTFLNAVEILRDPSHVRDHTIGQWHAMLGGAGFGVSETRTWPMRLDFDAWVERIGAPPEAEAALRFVFAQASREARAHFEVDDRLGFTITNALIVAERP